MDGATFIRRFREETADEAQPYLWSDALILRYLDEAQTEFCRRTEGIEDSVSRVCSVAVPAGASAVALNPKIRKVRSAHLVGGVPKLDLQGFGGCGSGGFAFGGHGWGWSHRHGFTALPGSWWHSN